MSICDYTWIGKIFPRKCLVRNLEASRLQHSGALLIFACFLGPFIALPARAQAPNLSGAIPTAPTSDAYSELRSKSAGLNAEQKANAQALFTTGFSLWQSGDFVSAVKAFKQGLDIDPANASANYYLGDCLLRSKQREEAKTFFSRASALGGTSPEAFKAATALEEMAKPVPFEEISSSEIEESLIGTWQFEGRSTKFTIAKESSGALKVSGSTNCFPIPPCDHFKDLVVDGSKIHFRETIVSLSYNLQLISTKRLSGDVNGNPIAADKK